MNTSLKTPKNQNNRELVQSLNETLIGCYSQLSITAVPHMLLAGHQYIDSF